MKSPSRRKRSRKLKPVSQLKPCKRDEIRRKTSPRRCVKKNSKAGKRVLAAQKGARSRSRSRTRTRSKSRSRSRSRTRSQSRSRSRGRSRSRRRATKNCAKHQFKDIDDHRCRNINSAAGKNVLAEYTQAEREVLLNDPSLTGDAIREINTVFATVDALEKQPALLAEYLNVQKRGGKPLKPCREYQFRNPRTRTCYNIDSPAGKEVLARMSLEQRDALLKSAEIRREPEALKMLTEMFEVLDEAAADPALLTEFINAPAPRRYQPCAATQFRDIRSNRCYSFTSDAGMGLLESYSDAERVELLSNYEGDTVMEKALVDIFDAIDNNRATVSVTLSSSLI